MQHGFGCIYWMWLAWVRGRQFLDAFGFGNPLDISVGHPWRMVGLRVPSGQSRETLVFELGCWQGSPGVVELLMLYLAHAMAKPPTPQEICEPGFVGCHHTP